MKKNYTLDAKRYYLTIGWLYPELMSTYGDRGNITVLAKRCEWRKISVEVKNLDVGFSVSELKTCDLLFMGGAQDTQQSVVSKDFSKDKVNALKSLIENGTPGLYICGAYQFLGEYYKEANGNKIPGLGIFDLYTEHPGENTERLIGNVLVKPSPMVKESFDFFDKTQDKSAQDDNDSVIIGFENHGGRTYLGKSIQPFGSVIKGFGNNGKDGSEGAVYKNSIGSYLHGPVLPKNPKLADFLIKKALERKYKKKIELEELDDSLELKAHDFIAKII